ncbi:hypothetical protein HYALB_00006271 [Hymenoscyphus albidus]|uniref:DUF218 domain-containing protein n=1 Tax=Hymenoscyphus albidus TaxID=595503 RepID=A0A9N9QDM9_9HELO|nr:hypothetical protein HYALB_00006271 [Hymenoscyphus albidus]
MPPPTPTNLIICCCHSIYLSTSPNTPPDPAPGTSPFPGTSRTSWLLTPFQHQEHHTFTTHIHTSLTLLSHDPLSLLVFSGGFTDSRVKTSEAASYLALCEDSGFWSIDSRSGHEDEGGEGKGKGSKERILLEEKAMDSLQNLLFGLLGFWRRTGGWPEKISVVSMGFKRGRVLGCHIPALKFPLSRVEFIGINPSYMDPSSPDYDEERMKSVLEGEKTRGFDAWKADMYGTGDVLRGKRISRDYFKTRGVWFESEEERERSGVRSEVRVFGDGVEEVLVEGRQPWEDS